MVIRIEDLPPPPAGRTGWPWTETGAPLEPGGPWSRVSIVTPSFNQGPYLEETIRSVLLQGYPDLEYIVIDGGSSDGSAEIIRKYERWLTFWVSEKDRGQSHAINKGFSHATGEVFGWLNSDDCFLPGGLAALMRLRRAHPEAVAWVGACDEVDVRGALIRRVPPRVGDKAAVGYWCVDAFFQQPGCLFPAKAFRRLGGVDERFHVALDVDLWLRLLDLGCFATTDAPVACARIYPEAKSQADQTRAMAELIAVAINNGVPESARKTLLRHAEPVWRDLERYRESYEHIMKRPPMRLYQWCKRGLRTILGCAGHASEKP